MSCITYIALIGEMGSLLNTFSYIHIIFRWIYHLHVIYKIISIHGMIPTRSLEQRWLLHLAAPFNIGSKGEPQQPNGLTCSNSHDRNPSPGCHVAYGILDESTRGPNSSSVGVSAASDRCPPVIQHYSYIENCPVEIVSFPSIIYGD